MPKLTANKDEVKGQSPLPEGLYTVRLKGFKPKLSKKKDSVNLNPDMEVINHPEHNNRKVFDSLSTKAKWTWKPFCAGFGVEMVANGDDFEFPGDFDGPQNQPEKWQYRGPLVGQEAQIYIIQVPVLDAEGNPAEYQGQSVQNRIKYYVDKFGTPQGQAIAATT